MGRAARLSEGTVVGEDFRIVRLLAEGGMGEVYLAEQLSTGAERALKVMHRHLVENPMLRKRFEQEARVSARIQSDFVVQVLAAGVDRESGLPWLAMERLEGEDLAAHLRREGALSPREALAILSPLCDALAAAHRIGVVHRDLKPENVFLATPRREGEPFTLKVLDFGIARLVAERNVASSTAAIGTPLWMAPEQTLIGAQVSPATDVWALGLLAFTLLTGRRHWLAAETDDVAMAPLLREITLDPLDAASARAKRLGCEGAIPDGFDAWFARAVSRDVGQRFRDARAAFDALAPILRDAPATFADEMRAKRPALPMPSLPTAEVGAPDAAVFAAAFAQPKALPPEPPRATPHHDVAEPPLVARTPPVANEEPERVPGVATFYRERLRADASAEPAREIAPAPGAPANDTASPAAIDETRPASGGSASTQPAPRTRALLPWALVAIAFGAAIWFARRTGPVQPSAQPIASSSTAKVAPPPSIGAAASASVDARALGEAESKKRAMATIQGGTFNMGSLEGDTNERPLVRVTVASFLLDVHEVTVESFSSCIAAGACTKPQPGPYCTYDDAAARAHDPINCVSFDQAQAYCGWLGRRLPTEAEWEYAAAGKDGRPFAWGFPPPNETRLCWGRCATKGGTCPVGSYPAGASPDGVFDLSGNVWEWTSTTYCGYAEPDCKDARKATRGGGWCGADPSLVRTRTREGRLPADATSNVGFRCARSL